MGRHLREPFADPSQVPTYIVSRLARQQVTVALSGDGGDELFAGYLRYAQLTGIWGAYRPDPEIGRATGSKVLAAMPDWALNRGYRAASPVLPPRLRGRRSVSGTRDRVVRILDARSPEDLMRILVAHSHTPDQLVLGATEARSILSKPSRWVDADDALPRVTYADSTLYLPDDILVKVDRAAMAVSLETRVPLLDHRVAEFSWQLPPEMKVRDGTTKWLLREVLRRYVPPELTDRDKMGFGVPVGDWIRGELKDWASSLLDESMLRRQAIFDPGPIVAAWKEHVSGVGRTERGSSGTS